MNNDFNSWDKYCNYLWFDKQVNIWLDISKINFTLDQISSLENKFKNVFSALKELEAGAISNIDEKRQVGHYWLRNPSVAPSNLIKDAINNEIRDITEFGENILEGKITNNKNQKFTNVLWIGIGGSGLGPLLITEALQENSCGLNFSYIDNIDPFLISEKLDELSDKLATTLFVVGRPEKAAVASKRSTIMQAARGSMHGMARGAVSGGRRLTHIASLTNLRDFVRAPEPEP